MTIAHQLLQKISTSKPKAKTVRRSADDLLKDLSNHIKWLIGRHVKKINSEEYYISSVFGKPKILKTKSEIDAYCRSHLVIADRCFDKLLNTMKDGKGKITSNIAQQYRDVLVPYIFDLRPIAEYLEKQKDPNYVFLRGDGSSHVHTWEVFRVSRQLAMQSAFRKTTLFLDHKTAQIASVFVLRQALEAKFDRLVAVDLYDKNFTRPRLQHGFNYDFIINNLQYFDFKAVNFKLLKKIYEWCNDVVHNVYRPIVWQIDYAHFTCEGLFQSINYGTGKRWNISNAVEINNLDQMRSAYISAFQNSYPHGTFWSIDLYDPEALII